MLRFPLAHKYRAHISHHIALITAGIGAGAVVEHFAFEMAGKRRLDNRSYARYAACLTALVEFLRIKAGNY